MVQSRTKYSHTDVYGEEWFVYGLWRSSHVLSIHTLMFMVGSSIWTMAVQSRTKYSQTDVYGGEWFVYGLWWSSHVLSIHTLMFMVRSGLYMDYGGPVTY